MPIYDADGTQLDAFYDSDGSELNYAYDAEGNTIYTKGDQPEPITPSVDYTTYTYSQVWASKSITSQDFTLYDGKVLWASKSGNASVPADCYIFDLATGDQIKKTTIYSGHANSISVDFPILYASTGYTPPLVYINELTSDFTATLVKTLYINDGCTVLDCCIDETDKTILWTHGKGGSSAETDIVSKWDLTTLTDNGDDTYTPRLIHSVRTPKPETLFDQETMYFQGCTFHDGMLWYPTWYSGVTGRIVAVNPSNGNVEYIISTGTTTEVEGVEFYPDAQAEGGYVMYMGFQGMMMRRYSFARLT